MIGYFADIEGHAGVETYSRELYERLDQDEVELIEPPSTLRPHLLNQVFLNTIKVRKSPHDTIHFTNQDDFAMLFPPKDKKYIVTVHDIFPYLEGFSGPFYSWLARRYVRNLEKHADKIIAISEATKEQLIEHTAVEPEIIEVIYEGVDLDTFRPVEADIEYEPYYIHVGSELERKNIPGLIRIFSRIKEKQSEATLVRVGNVTSKTEKVIEEEGLELGEDVIYESDITTEILVKLYSNAEKMIFPSIGEGFGRPILESLACETEVVAFNKKPMAELLSRELLVSFGNQQEFVERALSEKGKSIDLRSFAERFSWNKTTDQTKEIYREVR